MEDLKDIVTDIEQLDPTKKTGHHKRTADLICHILYNIDPAEADKYPDVTRAAVKFCVNNFPIVYLFSPHNVLGPPRFSKPSALRCIMRSATHMLYYCLKFNPACLPISGIFELLEHCNEYSLRNVENILTMTTRLDKTRELGPQYRLEICTSSNDCCTFHMLYTLLDLGMVQTVAQLLKNTPALREPQEAALSESMEDILTAIKQTPSLLQLARLAVRKCMRDVYVLEDCYKLPIPCHLQDYLSFRSLNAEIRPWFMKNEKPSRIDYMRYNQMYKVLSRFGLKDTDGPAKRRHVSCYKY